MDATSRLDSTKSCVCVVLGGAAMTGPHAPAIKLKCQLVLKAKWEFFSAADVCLTTALSSSSPMQQPIDAGGCGL